MFSTLRTRFGIPGVISVMALVFAMLGGAYAASNSSDAGKATASAKVKKGPRGPKGATGPAGPTGSQGPAGASGKDGSSGSNGSEGAPGAAGQSIVSDSLEEGDENCEFGGAEFTASSGTTFACNGAPGEEGLQGIQGNPWTAGGTLPPGATETGSWGQSQLGPGGEMISPVSFPVPLANPIGSPNWHVLQVNASPTADCPGSASDPKAASGHFCIYVSTAFNFATEEPITAAVTVRQAGASILTGTTGAGRAGSVLQFLVPELGFIDGTWAVTP